MGRPSIDQVAVLSTDDQEVYLCSAKQSQELGEAQRTISLILDTLVVQNIRDELIHRSLHFVVPDGLEVWLVGFILLESGIADANFEPCHAIVLSIYYPLVKYCLLVLGAEDLVDLATHNMCTILRHHL